MVEGQAEGQVEGQNEGFVSVVCETDEGYVELRLYGSGPLAPPSFWIGIFDTAGVLRRTWISDGLELNSRDVRRWLRPIVGYELADRLTRKALHVRSRSADDHRGKQVVHLTGGEPARAS